MKRKKRNDAAAIQNTETFSKFGELFLIYECFHVIYTFREEIQKEKAFNVADC
jgi:Ni/Fe-hydrogenase subunit HybB-like protein